MPRGPFKVNEFIGQRKNIEPLLRQQDGAIARGEPLSHCLFCGQSGLGKSLLARTLAERGGTKLLKLTGDVRPADVVATLTGLQPCDVLLLDEAHNLTNEVQEFLFEVIDGGEVPARHISGGTEPAEVAPLTLALATDRPGKLLNALLKRIPISVTLAPYPEAELKEIVEAVAGQRDLLLSPQAARQLATVCSGLPRRAEHLVRQVRHHFPDAESRQLGVADVAEFLRAWGVSKSGLGKQERRYLRFLADNGSASLESLAAHLGCDPDFARGQVEQVLRYRGLVRIRSSGRSLTARGERLVGRCRKPGQGGKGGRP